MIIAGRDCNIAVILLKSLFHPRAKIVGTMKFSFISVDYILFHLMNYY